MKLGATITQIRKERSLKQKELADLVGIGQSYMSKLEKETKTPSLETLEAIATALEIPLPILFLRSMEETDFPKGKREQFRVIYPMLKAGMETLTQ